MVFQCLHYLKDHFDSEADGKALKVFILLQSLLGVGPRGLFRYLCPYSNTP